MDDSLISSTQMSKRDLGGFFLAGLLNNTSYVIMIAGAKEISPSLVGLVYACNIIPSILVKSTGPYWFHLFSYKIRLIIASILMASSFIVVAIGSIYNQVWLELIGVALGSFQCGFGESSFLALTSYYNSRTALTAWSSGTGLAGIFGYGWVIVFTIGFNASFQITLFAALILPILYLVNFVFIISPPKHSDVDIEERKFSSVLSPSLQTDLDIARMSASRTISTNVLFDKSVSKEKREKLFYEEHMKSDTMTPKQRFDHTIALWPFMIPLIVVYFAEYTMMSGIWSAMGFPIDSSNARDKFYVYSTWMYQVGVLISRSSGLVYKADMKAIWIMPAIQSLLLVFFTINAYLTWWYDWSILMLCFCVGLLGGGVYVGSFALLAETVLPNLKEFSLAAASISADIGITFSTIAGIFLQKALYNYHNISDDE